MKISFVLIPLLLIVATLGGLLFFALRDAVSPEQLAPADIIHFKQFKAPETPPTQLTVVSYNIGYASGEKNNEGSTLSEEEVQKNLKQIVAVLKSLNADIIALQEVDFRADRTFRQDQLQYLAEQLQMPYAAYVITWNKRYVAWPYWPPKRHFGAVVSGQAVFSRYPITEQALIPFAKPEENSFWYNWFYLDRIAQDLSIETGTQHLSVWNVHLEAYSEEARKAQLQEISDRLQEDRHDIELLIGDYNTDDLKVFIQTTGLQNAVTNKQAHTFSSWEPAEKIDHILYHGVRLEASGVQSGVRASDHLPVWGRFKLEEKR